MQTFFFFVTKTDTGSYTNVFIVSGSKNTYKISSYTNVFIVFGSKDCTTSAKRSNATRVRNIEIRNYKAYKKAPFAL